MQKLPRILYLVLTLSVVLIPSAVIAQPDDVISLKTQGRALIDAQKFTQALPVYEKLAKLAPKDPEVFRNLAFSLLGQAANTEGEADQRALRIRARDSFILARDLGDDSLLVKGLIEGLPADGSAGKGYSDNAEANRMMDKAEAFFGQGKLDEAFDAYQKALALDPYCYHAALFSGDVMTQTSKWDEAEKWYQRAISIDPYIETAYRYSATPFMRQQKYDRARDRYVEAYITAPFNKLAVGGIVQWGQATNTRLGHPKINAPESTVGPDGKSKTTITVNPQVDDGGMAWIAYSATRDGWKKDLFNKNYPKETAYRHSLKEEAEALRSVVTMAKTLKPKTLNPDIALIEKMDKEGVLEAYILMARADEGIVVEYLPYLKAYRDKLRLYVLNYVIEKK